MEFSFIEHGHVAEQTPAYERSDTRSGGRTVLICGSRIWTDLPMVEAEIARLRDEGFTTIIEGEAKGADTHARIAGTEYGLKVIRVPADWNTHGRAAGPIRNRRMLEMGPDLIVAFSDNLPQSRGTMNMVAQGLDAGIEVRLCRHQRSPDRPFAPITYGGQR